WLIIRIVCRALGLNGLEALVVVDGAVDGAGGQQRVETAVAGGLIVLFQDGFGNGLARCAAVGPGRFRITLSFAGVLGLFRFDNLRCTSRRFKIIDVEAQHVFIFNGVGDGVGVQLLLEDVFGGLVGADPAVDLLVAGVGLENGRAGKAEQLRVGE